MQKLPEHIYNRLREVAEQEKLDNPTNVYRKIIEVWNKEFREHFQEIMNFG